MSKYGLIYRKRDWVPNCLYVPISWAFNISRRLSGEEETAITKAIKRWFHEPVPEAEQQPADE